MKELKIIATIVAKSETNADIYASLTKVVDATRTESGNISYTLHRDINNPLSYTIIECWRGAEAIDLHNASEHFKAFIKEIEGKVSSVDIATVEEIY